MGRITAHETADGRRYRVRFRDPDRKSRENSGFTRKKDAEDFLANVTVSTNRGEYVDLQTAKSTILELATEWVANQTHLKPPALIVVDGP
jgi:hypothetical protein